MESIKYSIEIKRPSKNALKCEKHKNDKYTVWYEKHCGDMFGGVSSFATLYEVKEFLISVIKSWEEYDSILGRIPDKITRKNLQLESFTSDINIAFILGDQTLVQWI